MSQWERVNRAPVHRDRLNRWVFAINADEYPSDADVERIVRGTLKRLQGGESVDLVRIVRTSPTAIAPGTGTAHRREGLSVGPLPLLSGPRATWAEVEFAWRSPVPSVPWPAQAGLLNSFEPEAADILLDSVGYPGDVAPAPTTPGDEIGDALGDAARKLASGLAGALVLGGLVWFGLSSLKGK